MLLKNFIYLFKNFALLLLCFEVTANFSFTSRSWKFSIHACLLTQVNVGRFLSFLNVQRIWVMKILAQGDGTVYQGNNL